MSFDLAINGGALRFSLKWGENNFCECVIWETIRLCIHDNGSQGSIVINDETFIIFSTERALLRILHCNPGADVYIHITEQEIASLMRRIKDVREMLGDALGKTPEVEKLYDGPSTMIEFGVDEILEVNGKSPRCITSSEK